MREAMTSCLEVKSQGINTLISTWLSILSIKIKSVVYKNIYAIYKYKMHTLVECTDFKLNHNEKRKIENNYFTDLLTYCRITVELLVGDCTVWSLLL